ncbi:OmpA family protein [Elusimicrobiota bacterium]
MSVLKIFIAALMIASPLTVSAHFEDIGVGARSIGMASAYTAIAEDAYAMYYNPACLEGVKWKELGMNYEKLYLGLSDNSNLGSGYVGYAQELKSIGKLKLGGTIGVGWLNFALSKYYSENTLILGYGRKIEYEIKGNSGITKILNHIGSGRFSGGLNVKVLSKGFGSTRYTENAVNLDTGQRYGGRDPVFRNGYTKSGVGIDLGLVYKMNDWHRFAMMLRDINSPDMGLKEDDRVGRRLKMGYGYIGKNLTTAVDLTIGCGDVKLQGGAEKWFMERMLAVRSGLGIGSREYAELTLGGSYRYNKVFYLDYSFRYPLRGIRGVAGSHQISISMKIGAPEPGVGKEVRTLKRELETARKELTTERTRMKKASEEAAQVKEEANKAVRDAKKMRKEVEQIVRQIETVKVYVEEERIEEVVEMEDEADDDTELRSMVMFDRGEWELKPSGKRAVDHIAETLIVFPLQKLKVEGHADLFEDVPDEVAKKRAEAIRDYLVGEFQIDTDRMIIESFGTDKPAADPTTEEGMAKNRRVEMTFVE